MNRDSLTSFSKEELIALIEALTKQIGVLTKRVEALEAELGKPPKTPDNSSVPPSQGHKANGESETKPKAKSHAGAHRPLHPNPTRRRDVLTDRCEHCRADVSAVPQAAVHAYDRIEIPEIVPDVTRVTLHGGVCPCCRRRFRAAPPAGLAPGSPFGPNLRGFVLYLRFAQAIPFERLARLMSDLLGLEISEGALANMLEASGSAFAHQTSLIRDRLLSGTVLQSDETSARVGNKGWAQTAHQACLAHLLRDVQYAIDAGDISFAPGIKNLLKQAIAIGHRRDRLADATLAVYAARLEAKLDRLLQIEPANRQGQKLLRIIKKYRQNLFVFVTSRAVPPTNNGSEQALRPCVIFRKITNCFRSHWGARLYVDVRSVFETARRRGIPILQAIRLTLDGQPLPVAPSPACRLANRRAKDGDGEASEREGAGSWPRPSSRREVAASASSA
jgi:transposase